MTRVVALSGGVGGAKLALGLSMVLNADELLIVANTADDFEHLGFYICPDIDTLLYTLGGVSNTETGWGRADETWEFMEELRSTNSDEAWFLLGDKDLDVHRFRTAGLARGDTLTEVTEALARQFGVRTQVLPMSDEPVRTHVLAETEDGDQWLPFQEYFVRYRCEPHTRRIEFRGSGSAPATLETALSGSPVDAIVVCPSNPYLSVDPILAVDGMTRMLLSTGAPIVAVSPVVGGRAIKGPTAKIMQELGVGADVEAIANHYRGFADGLVIDHADAEATGRIRAAGLAATVTNTVMKSIDDRKQLARDVLEFAGSLR